jgi:hypothetical protein
MMVTRQPAVARRAANASPAIPAPQITAFIGRT